MKGFSFGYSFVTISFGHNFFQQLAVSNSDYFSSIFL